MGATDQVEKLNERCICACPREEYLRCAANFDLGKTPAENAVSIIDPTGAVALTHLKFGGNQFEGTLKGDGVLQNG